MSAYSNGRERVVSHVDGRLLRTKEEGMIALMEPVVAMGPDGPIATNHRTATLAAGTMFMIVGINVGRHDAFIEILIDGIRAWLATGQVADGRHTLVNKVKRVTSWLDAKTVAA